MIPNNYECEGQMNFLDASAHTLQVLQSLKIQIQWREDHATTNVARYTYGNCLDLIEQAIEKEKN